jgi:hypothetical protein
MTVWADLSHDPRETRLAGLRAGDADRDVVQDLLNQAYADGRLDPDQHDERATALAGAATLGDLRDLVVDLVPEWEPTAVDPPATPARRRLVLGFLLPSIACVLLWRFAAPGLFWPLWVIVYTGLPLLRAVRTERQRR